MRISKSRIIADVAQDQAVVYFTSPHVRDLGDVQKIASEIEELAYNYNLKLIVINFRKLKQMTSAFLSRLIALNKSLRQLNIKLHLCCMNPQVERAFRICKLHKVMPLFKTEEKALS